MLFSGQLAYLGEPFLKTSLRQQCTCICRGKAFETTRPSQSPSKKLKNNKMHTGKDWFISSKTERDRV